MRIKLFGRNGRSLLFVGVLIGANDVSCAEESSAKINNPESKDHQNTGEEDTKYDAAAEDQKEKDEIARLSNKVAELNRNADRDGKRMYELQNAIDTKSPGFSKGVKELQQLRQSQAVQARMLYMQELEARQIELSKKFTATELKIKKLQASRGSWFNDENELDKEEIKLHRWSSSLAAASRINKVLLQRLKSGATTFSEGATTNEDLQERFFPTR